MRLVGALYGQDAGAVDASALAGSLAGYVVERPLSPRQTIDPLADVFQFDMVETGEALCLQPRGGVSVAAFAVVDLAQTEAPAFVLTTAQRSDAPTAIRLSYIDEGGDYRPAVAEARLPYADETREPEFEIRISPSATRLAMPRRQMRAPAD